MVSVETLVSFLPRIKHEVTNFGPFLSLQTNSSTPTEPKERKKKESIVDLSRYLEKIIRVKFAGGREVSGILKGYDPLVNLVLDNTTEYLRGMILL